MPRKNLGPHSVTCKSFPLSFIRARQTRIVPFLFCTISSAEMPAIYWVCAGDARRGLSSSCRAPTTISAGIPEVALAAVG
jgi:hypothetical protein